MPDSEEETGALSTPISATRDVEAADIEDDEGIAVATTSQSRRPDADGCGCIYAANDDCRGLTSGTDNGAATMTRAGTADAMIGRRYTGLSEERDSGGVAARLVTQPCRDAGEINARTGLNVDDNDSGTDDAGDDDGTRAGGCRSENVGDG